MAYMVPEVLRTGATAGERLLFRSLKEHLPSDYAVYFEPEIEGCRPAFVVIGPDLGMVVLEVTEYTRSALVEADRGEWQVYTASGQLETVPNPYLRARDTARQVAAGLEKDDGLTEPDVNRKGKQLLFQLGFGTVFTRMRRNDFIENGLYEVIAEPFVLCRDEIDREDGGFSADALIEKIHGMFTEWKRNRSILSKEQLWAIRNHLTPAAKLGSEFRPPESAREQYVLSLHQPQAMDVTQENIAKQLGDRHRLIRGVTGSGKTLVLASRAKMLASFYPDWKILVICNSVALSQSLKQMIGRMMDEPEDLLDWIRLAEQREGRPDKPYIEVFNFHEWLKKALGAKDTDVLTLIAKLEKKEAILPMYEAILIDEGQDFQPEWLRLLTHLLNPATQNLLLVEDKTQSFFKRKSSLLKATGLDFRGRSRFLSVNYRNTSQIAKFAWDFYQRYSLLRGGVQYGSAKGVDIIPPQSARRAGPEPAVIRCGSFKEEVRAAADRIRELHVGHKIPYAEMAILYRVKDNYHSSYIDAIRRELKGRELPYRWLAENDDDEREEAAPAGDAVNVASIDSVKGLDFQAVFIVNAENMPFSLEMAEEREVSLFYVAMTRALEWLFVSYSGDSKFTPYLDEVRNRAQERESDPERKQPVKLLG
ncbi:DEAD/DEAH box helicase [Paenibacillus arenilitoris]|uniref:AAA family ATPase n=1 Tax=Paenibacillus arenilitoris TaxID=2772299 RepID=A0A927CTZ4_9BACL|nr:3'-5' exonuclease [Paenibacillus arenilitoris]MBD2871826.1 AAA family ATPase [Paenibacillus arenilitoris]